MNRSYKYTANLFMDFYADNKRLLQGHDAVQTLGKITKEELKQLSMLMAQTQVIQYLLEGPAQAINDINDTLNETL